MGDHFEVVEALLRIPYLFYDGAVDTTDRMNYLVSTILFIAASIVIVFREYIMDPITCYMPSEVGGTNLLIYMENYCWAEGTMSLTDPRNKKLPDTTEEWDKFLSTRTVYYQWVPFMFIVQCAMFYMPQVFWTMICTNIGGFNVNQFVKSIDKVIPDARINQSARNISYLLFDFCIQNRKLRSPRKATINLPSQKKGCRRISMSFNFPIGKRKGIWLIIFYMTTKFLYLTNTIGQMYLMQHFLQFQRPNSEYGWLFGYQLLWNIAIGRNWEKTGAFPRVAYCMARIRQQASSNVQVAQCVLTANLFIEKMYIFFWFWTMFMITITTISILIWIKKFFALHSQIERYLIVQTAYSGVEFRINKEKIRNFTHKFLGYDGMFLTEIVAMNRGRVLMGPVVQLLFDKWEDYAEKTNTQKIQYNENNNDECFTPNSIKETPLADLEDKLLSNSC